jgi:hypothetical protein
LAHIPRQQLPFPFPPRMETETLASAQYAIMSGFRSSTKTGSDARRWNSRRHCHPALSAWRNTGAKSSEHPPGRKSP